MRYLAIHFREQEGEKIAYPAFEMEAEAPDEQITAVFKSPDTLDSDDMYGQALLDLKRSPDVTAGEQAVLLGVQHVGVLAEKESGLVVSGANGLLPDADKFHWHELNPPSFWTGDPDDDVNPDPGPVPAGEMNARQVLEEHALQ